MDFQNIYNGTPLYGREIRLLRFLPHPGTEAGFRARLFTASLDDPPPYDALSYRWEESVKLHTIPINDFNIALKNNLFQALKKLQTAHKTQLFNLWVDGICINQSSTEERNDQVSLMGEIYSKAKMVHIWIGETGSTNVDAAFRLLSACPRDPGDANWVHVPNEDSNIESYVQQVSGDFQGATALTEILHRSYWNRMWVFQEIVLAQRAEVHCGSKVVPWSHFSRLDRIMGNHEIWVDAQNQHPWIFDLRKAVFRIAHLAVTRDEATSLQNVLQPTRHLECQDPRDKLYALLGVCPGLAELLHPDYSIAPRDVYTSFARYQITKDGNLSTLATAGLSRTDHDNDIDLPSWVPDLRSTDGVDIRYLSGISLQRFDAAGPTEAAIEFLSDGGYDILKIRAFLTDILDVKENLVEHGGTGSDTALDKFCAMYSGSTPSVAQVRQFFRAIIFEDATFYGQADDCFIEQEMEKGFYRDLEKKFADGKSLQNFPGIVSSKQFVKQQVKERQKKCLKRLILGFAQECCQYFGSHEGLIADLLDSFQDIGMDLRRGPRHDPLQGYDTDDLDLTRCDFSARTDQGGGKEISAIFKTQKGRIGIGAKIIQPGDEIALVYGCRVPLVLRQEGAFYRLVGPCYVAGIMQGEAVGSSNNFGLVEIV